MVNFNEMTLGLVQPRTKPAILLMLKFADPAPILAMHCYTPALTLVYVFKNVVKQILFELFKVMATIRELLGNETCLNDRIEIYYP